MSKDKIASQLYIFMNWYWIQNHYDIHLSGYCYYNGELCRFETIDKYFDEDYDEDEYIYCDIFSLTFMEKIKAHLRKKMFEICVGKHWSYPERSEGVLYYRKWPNWFWERIEKLYYKF